MIVVTADLVTGFDREDEAPSFAFGDPRLPARFWSKVQRTDTCWLWKGYCSSQGYGFYGRDERNYPARVHRLAYTKLVGPIPEGLVIDHLCRVRNCVNPEHLEPVTPIENVMRGESNAARNAHKTHCKRGHEFTPENTRWCLQGGRECLACKRWHFENRRAKELARAALSSVGGEVEQP